jgi:predicted Zn-dependent protease
MKTFIRAQDNLTFLKKNKQPSLNLYFYPQQIDIKVMPELCIEENISVEDKKALAFQIEDLTLKQDSRVVAVVHSGLVENKYQMRMLNSLGMDQSYQKSNYTAYVSPLMKDNNSSKTNMAVVNVRSFNEINALALAQVAVARTSALLGAHS